MANDRRALIAGGAATAFGGHHHSTPREWVAQVTESALKDAHLDASDIDAVVVASESDFFSLQLSPGPLLLDEVGLVPCPVVRVENGGASGASAIQTAFVQILSGVFDRVLVIGFEHTASHLGGDHVRMLYGLSFDADLEGMAGVQAVHLYALSVADYMRRHQVSEEMLACVSVKNHGNALHNPLAHKPMQLSVADVLASPTVSHPYKRLDCSLISDGAAAVVLASPDAAPTGCAPTVRIAGTGCASDFVRLGDRPCPGEFSAKRRSAEMAYRMAGIKDPARDIHVAELYDAFTGAELQAIEALRLGVRGRAGVELAAGEYDARGRLPINLSGGLLGQGGAPGATGVMQAWTIYRLLTGNYELAPASTPRVGLSDAHGGVSTVSVTHVYERLE